MRTLESNIILSPSGEAQPNGFPTIPLGIQLNPASDEVDAREIDLVLSVLDDIVQEMQRLGAELESDACLAQSDQHQPIFNRNCC